MAANSPDSAGEAPRENLRIGMLLESDGPGGAETVALRLAAELTQRGHVVVPVTPEHGVGWLAEQYRAIGLNSRSFYLKRTLDPGLVRRLTKLYRDERLDVVHSHEFTMAFYGSIATRLSKTPHVVTMHGGQGLASVLRRRLAMRIAVRLSERTVTISEATKAEMCRSIGLIPTSLGVVPNGVPVTTGNPKAIQSELGLARASLVITAVGNLDPRKAHIDLLRGAHLARAALDRFDWHIVIAGGRGGPEFDRLRAFASDNGFSERLHILLNRTDVADILAATTIFVMPSLWEGMPMAILEAMIAGKPVVATRVSGIPECVSDGATGLLVPPQDPVAIAASLRKLVNHPELIRQLGEQGRSVALRRFTVQAMADSYLQVYEEAIAARQRGRID